jgi:hypothetical protein
MHTRLPYIGLFVLALPALYWGYSLLSAPDYLADPWLGHYIGASLGLILAIAALYGLVIGKPFAQLHTALKVVIIIAAAVNGLFMAVFLLVAHMVLS